MLSEECMTFPKIGWSRNIGKHTVRRERAIIFQIVYNQPLLTISDTPVVRKCNRRGWERERETETDRTSKWVKKNLKNETQVKCLLKCGQSTCYHLYTEAAVKNALEP